MFQSHYFAELRAFYCYLRKSYAFEVLILLSEISHKTTHKSGPWNFPYLVNQEVLRSSWLQVSLNVREGTAFSVHVRKDVDRIDQDVHEGRHLPLEPQFRLKSKLRINNIRYRNWTQHTYSKLQSVGHADKAEGHRMCARKNWQRLTYNLCLQLRKLCVADAKLRVVGCYVLCLTLCRNRRDTSYVNREFCSFTLRWSISRYLVSPTAAPTINNLTTWNPTRLAWYLCLCSPISWTQRFPPTFKKREIKMSLSAAIFIYSWMHKSASRHL